MIQDLGGGYIIDIKIDGAKYWYLNGKLHRTDGPAIEYSNGDKEWFLNGVYHRVNGPAIICVNVYNYTAYFIHGKRHRLDGPAREWREIYKKEWYINNKEYTEEDYLVAIQYPWMID